MGHFAVGFAAKAAAPRTSLGTLFAAAQCVDLVWPTFLLLGWEEVKIEPGATVVTPLDFAFYPYTHSLTGAAAWAVAAGLVYYAVRRYGRGALVVGAAVISHWFLDLVMHRPDLPLTFTGTTRVGLGLWNSLAGTLIVELGLLAAGVLIYLRATRARDGVGKWALAGLVGFLLVVYAANVLGPPPASVSMIAWGAQLLWLVVLWAFWVDRHRGQSPS